jgi:hypothetical protein
VFFVCVCFICVVFVFLCYFCLCIVLCLLLATWPFTHHSNHQESNWNIISLLNNKSDRIASTCFGISEFFYWLSSFNGAKWIALLMWQKKWLWTLWNWRFMVLFVLNTEVNTVTFNHGSQNSHSAPSGCKIGKLMCRLQCLLGWLWNKILCRWKKQLWNIFYNAFPIFW